MFNTVGHSISGGCHEASKDRWWTTAQIEHVKRAAKADLTSKVQDALKLGVRGANARAPRGGLVNVSFTFRPGHREYVAPLIAAEALEQRSACEACGCRYAAIGAVFFCPACGHNSARSTFEGAMRTIRGGLDVLPLLPDLMGKDAASDFARDAIESGLGRIVTAFQRYAEATYDALPIRRRRRARTSSSVSAMAAICSDTRLDAGTTPSSTLRGSRS